MGLLSKDYAPREQMARLGISTPGNRSVFGSNLTIRSKLIVLIQTTPFLSTAVAYGWLYAWGRRVRNSSGGYGRLGSSDAMT